MDMERVGASGGQMLQWVVFALGVEEYGVPIQFVKEIIRKPEITQLPNAPEFIQGVINLRGNVVPVVNLARRFDHEPREIAKRTSIIIIDIRDNDEQSVEVGIVVDIVNEVIELADTDIAAAPTFGAKIRADFIQGMGKIDDKLMILLDVDHVLAINELSKVIEISDDLNSSSTNQVALLVE